VKRDAKGFCSSFFSVASILDGCGDVGYLLIDRLEKRQMQGARGKKDENWRGNEEGDKTLLFGVGGGFIYNVI
jgi:hypothetical protein